MILIFGLFFLLITLIPIGLSYLVFRWLSKKGHKRIGLAILAIVSIWTVYSTYTAFYPTDSFYEDEFANNTGLDFPTSGYILTKDASYPDLHGDYSATAVFKTNKNDFTRIFTGIQNNTNFQLDTTIKDTSFNRCYTTNRQDRDLIFSISFNETDHLIEIQRDSW